MGCEHNARMNPSLEALLEAKHAVLKSVCFGALSASQQRAHNTTTG
jgi:hypothetical protein